MNETRSMICLERKKEFSASHHYGGYDLPGVDAFTGGGEPLLHGHNYAIFVTVAGDPDPDTGMVVNIKLVDKAIQDAVVAEFDHACINDAPYFRERPPILENLLLYTWPKLVAALGSVTLTKVRIAESPRQAAEYRGPEDPMIYVSKTLDFAAAHRLHNSTLSDEENRELFGFCNNPHGHGHNYVLEVTVKGEPDPRTGAVCDVFALEEAIETHCVGRLDHKFLDKDVPELAGQITSTENLVATIWRMLEDHIPGGAALHAIRVWETDRSCFEYRGPDENR